MENQDYTYEFLKSLDNIEKESGAFLTPVNRILKDFMFKNLLSDSSVFCNNPPQENDTKFEQHKISIQKIRHSIINYLYSGKFTLEEIVGKYNYSDEVQKIIQENLSSNFDFEIQNYQAVILYMDQLTK